MIAKFPINKKLIKAMSNKGWFEIQNIAFPQTNNETDSEAEFHVPKRVKLSTNINIDNHNHNHVSAGNVHQQDLNNNNVTSNNSNNNIDPINNEIEEINDSFATQNISSHQTCDFLEERDQLKASILCNF